MIAHKGTVEGGVPGIVYEVLDKVKEIVEEWPSDWNDDPIRTRDEVIAVLRKAACAE